MGRIGNLVATCSAFLFSCLMWFGIMRYLKYIFPILIVLVSLAWWQVKNLIVAEGPLQEVVNVVIPKGANTKIVAQELENAGVVNSKLLFRLVTRLNQADKKLKAGEYQFMPKVSVLNVMEKIARGEVYYRKITIPEGLTVGQIMYMISNYPGLSGEITLEVQEGELLPETYSFELDAPRDSIILQAKTAMDKIKQVIWDNRAEGLPYKNINEMMTMASIIEKETSVPEERAVVASVFVNRLEKRMRLQTDPTVIYALTDGEFELERALRKNDLNINSPFNTYRNYGLPPHPICNPGVESMEAAAHPQKSDYLYFVADGKGGHNFAKSLKEHNRNVRKWKKK